jgi:hypothetical protein
MHPSGARFFRRVVPLAVTGLSVLACSGEGLAPKPVPAEKMDYVGHWSGTGVDLSITPEGMVDWEKKEGASRSSLNAPITEWTDDGFKAGVSFLTTEFHVDSPPAEVDGAWKMTIEGVEVTRADASGAQGSPAP